jgi:hypothetical protein
MPTPEPGRLGRIVAAAVAFFLFCAVVLTIALNRYLIPAAAAAQGADPAARRQLAALSALVLSVLLVCMLVMLVILFRPGRMFLMRKSEPRTRTKYVDAWAEAGRRLEVEPDEPDGDLDEPSKPA